MPTRRLEIEGRHASPATVPVSFDGKTFMARPGEPWAVTLLAHGVYTLGRSSKYHRPRGMFCGVGSCGQCVARVEGLPNVKLCRSVCVADATAQSQNTLGNARFDGLEAVDWIFAKGLDHHHLLVQTGLINRVAVAMARQLAGLGRLPARPAVPKGAEPQRVHVQVAVVGAGVAGRAVATVTRRHGLDTWLLESGPSIQSDVRAEHHVLGFYDDQELLVTTPGGLLRLRADAVVLATGGYELPPPCPGNDVPGVMGRRAAELALQWGVLPGRRVAVALPPNADAAVQRQARQLVSRLQRAGATLVQVIGLGSSVPRAAVTGTRLLRIEGAAPELQVHSDASTVDCDALIWCARPAPAYELARQMGVDTPFNADLGGFVPVAAADGSTAQEGVYIAGELAGMEAFQAAPHGELVGETLAQHMRIDPGVALA